MVAAETPPLRERPPALPAGLLQAWPAVVLAIQNLVIFWKHYFGIAGIPWDFGMSYYAMVAFWTTSVRHRVIPEWLPFQQMGYPFAMQAQSGINYPPLWIFPALNIPYTMRAAIVVQCLHIFFGSIGMFVLTRRLGRPRGYALLAAIAFQFFGGFYSNAEHVDIVRAFAFSPWLLYAYSFGGQGIARRLLLVPVVLCLFLTGGYPGNVIAGGLIIGVFVLLETTVGLSNRDQRSAAAIWLALVVVMTLLGIGMSLTQWGPIWIFRDQFFRADPSLPIPRESLWIDQIPGFFLSNASIPGEISMTSTYVTLPMLAFVCFTPIRTLRERWVYLALGIAASILAAGDHTPVAPFLRRTVPTLGLSRFPSSDYRVFIAIPLLLFATSGLQAILEKELSLPSMTARFTLCVAGLLWGLSRVDHLTGQGTVRALFVAVATAIAITVLRWRSARLGPASVAIIASLIAIDAARVLSDMVSWRVPDMDAYYKAQSWPAYLQDDGRLTSSAIFDNLPATRPQRFAPEGLLRWSGYLDGRYYTSDLTPNVLRLTGILLGNPVYQRYMTREWLAILLSRSAGAPPVVTDEQLNAAMAAPPNSNAAVRQRQYGINRNRYDVSLEEPALLVENEVYFPGWKAHLNTPTPTIIEATSSNGVFRAWRLPRGQYSMETTFAFPHMRAFRSTAIVSGLAWILACFWLWYRSVASTFQIGRAPQPA